METTIVYWGSIRIMEKKMESTIVFWGSIRIMEKKMEATIAYCFRRKMKTRFLKHSPAQRFTFVGPLIALALKRQSTPAGGLLKLGVPFWGSQQ